MYSFGRQRFFILEALLTSGFLFAGTSLNIYYSSFRVLNTESDRYPDELLQMKFAYCQQYLIGLICMYGLLMEMNMH